MMQGGAAQPPPAPGGFPEENNRPNGSEVSSRLVQELSAKNCQPFGARTVGRCACRRSNLNREVSVWHSRQEIGPRHQAMSWLRGITQNQTTCTTTADGLAQGRVLNHTTSEHAVAGCGKANRVDRDCIASPFLLPNQHPPQSTMCSCSDQQHRGRAQHIQQRQTAGATCTAKHHGACQVSWYCRFALIDQACHSRDVGKRSLHLIAHIKCVCKLDKGRHCLLVVL